MKVLWFSNVILGIECKTSGSWLYTMSESLVHMPDFYLVNITQSSSVKAITKKTISENFTQYVLPIYKLENGLPEKNNISDIKNIVDNEAPDIIHIWGTESYWGLLTARKIIKGLVLLEMQGIIATCYDAFYANLSPKDLFRCISYKELLLPNRSLFYMRKRFKKHIKYENEIIHSHMNVSVQSPWVEQYIKLINPDVDIYHTLISVRTEFFQNLWNKTLDSSSIIISTISSNMPYKGLLDLLHSMVYIKKYYPNIKLYIIGHLNTSLNNLRTSGYEKLIMRTINDLGLRDNVIFCGSLNSQQIVNCYLESDVYVQTSYVESYSLSLAEAMALGIPCVCSYAGAMSYLGKDEESLMFYTPGDVYACASKILRIINDESLRHSLSLNSRKLAFSRNRLEIASERQINIYNKLLNKN